MTDTNIKHKSFRLIAKAVVTAFAIIGAMFVLLLILASNILLPRMENKIEIEKNSLIHIDFDSDFSETQTEDLVSEVLGEKGISFAELLKVFEAAAHDENISAISAKINNSGLGVAQIDEVRKAVMRFRQSGKKAYIYSEGFGSFGGGLSEYYLASAFDEIWMQPKTVIGTTGISIEIPFFKNLLEKIGVEPEFFARHEYKNAIASMLDEKMNAPYRQEMEKLVNGIGDQIVEEISKSRNIPTDEIMKIINSSPVFAEDGVELGLVDKIGYINQFFEAIDHSAVVSAEDYSTSVYSIENDDKLAVMFLEGIISSGKSSAENIQSDAVIGAETVLKTLEEIMKNEDIKALVVRVNSPGGEYTAAAQIWYALNDLREKKKIPVVVSQGDYAASGGYFISLAADKIYADPTTLTGSIGVFGGKFIFSELFKKLSVNIDGVKFGNNAGINSYTGKFSAEEEKIFNKSLDIVYEDFTAKTAEARKISLEDVDKLARGRVWTGKQAVENHLVDGLGGLYNAIQEAAKMADLKNFEIIEYPSIKTFKEKIADFISGQANISVNKIFNIFGFKPSDIRMLENMQKNTAYMPLKINM